MTDSELLAALYELACDAAPVDTDVAAVLAALARMLRLGVDLSAVSAAVLAAEEAEMRRQDRIRR